MLERRRAPRAPLKLSIPPCLERIRVVLVEPQTPGNVGATARAMKTMGLSRLVLVAPTPGWDGLEARARAHGAIELLESAHVVEDLHAACAGAHLLVGTTNRRRARTLPDPTTTRDAAARIVDLAQSHEVALLFGREDAGLTTRELGLCQVCATIPAARELPSLNLSHAVQVFVYEIFLAALGTVPQPAPDLPTVDELEALYDRIVRLMIRAGFTPHEDDPETFIVSLRRSLSRAALEKRDVRTLQRVLSVLDRRLRQLSDDAHHGDTETRSWDTEEL